MSASSSPETLAERFSRIGVTRRQLAKEAGVDENTLGRILRGRSANTRTVDKIAAAISRREQELSSALARVRVEVAA